MIERKWVPSLVERAKSAATRIMLVEAIESAHSLVPFLHAINNERAVIEIVRASGVADALDRIANQHCDVIRLRTRLQNGPKVMGRPERYWRPMR
jgi:hypothetical protein